MKGILFKPDMHKAIEEGRKTQTRRVIKELEEPDKWVFEPQYGWFRQYKDDFSAFTLVIKPRYQVGEVLYIKEAWAVNPTYDDLKPSQIPHDAFVTYLNDRYNAMLIGKKRSPLFMPAWAARYFIQITDVSSERLQDITEKDAIAEGVELGSARGHFSILWDSINPKYSWSSNPFVWVYGVKKAQHA